MFESSCELNSPSPRLSNALVTASHMVIHATPRASILASACARLARFRSTQSGSVQRLLPPRTQLPIPLLWPQPRARLPFVHPAETAPARRQADGIKALAVLCVQPLQTPHARRLLEPRCKQLRVRPRAGVRRRRQRSLRNIRGEYIGRRGRRSKPSRRTPDEQQGPRHVFLYFGHGRTGAAVEGRVEGRVERGRDELWAG